MSLIIDIHALHTLPPSLINRDDTGAPKSAVYGGVPRQRVSSQSWKRAIRKYFETHVDAESVGDRSKRIPAKIGRKVEDHEGGTLSAPGCSGRSLQVRRNHDGSRFQKA